MHLLPKQMKHFTANWKRSKLTTYKQETGKTKQNEQFVAEIIDAFVQMKSCYLVPFPVIPFVYHYFLQILEISPKILNFETKAKMTTQKYWFSSQIQRKTNKFSDQQDCPVCVRRWMLPRRNHIQSVGINWPFCPERSSDGRPLRAASPLLITIRWSS